MLTWTKDVGRVLHELDPARTPKRALEGLWPAVAEWGTIDGIWLRCLPGHLQPAGTALAGNRPDNAEEIAEMAGATTASINTDGLPVMARQLRDGNVPIALILVAHHDASQPAAFLVDAICRYLLDRLRVQLETSELAEENHYLRGELTPRVDQHDIITVSGTMEHVIRSAVRAASSNATVLIQGETGTGKELVARLLQGHSTRAHKPLVTVNAGSLAANLLESELFGHVRGAFTGAEHDRKGLFEVADGGTVFLDEVGELPLEAQVRLLRVLQERTVTRVGDHQPRPVDVRVIAATHRDLAREVGQGRFRQDLFYRLNVVTLVLPPLRERREDIPVLVNHFLQRFNREHFKHVEHVPRALLDMFLEYPWPGNVRELENCIQKAVVLAPGSALVPDLVPPTIRSWSAAELPPPEAGLPPAPALAPKEDFERSLERFAEAEGAELAGCFRAVERHLIAWALDQERGIKLRAARRLGINRVTLDRKIHEYGFDVRRGLGVIRAEPTAAG